MSIPLMYGFSPSPANSLTFTGELMERPLGDRKMALATFLSSSGTKCSLPALRAEPSDASTDTWEVDCSEGSYILMMSDESWIVVDNSADPADPQAASPGPPRQTLPLTIE